MSSEIIEKAKYYQRVSVWPRTTKLNYTGWLSNFEGEDLELAKRILDFFVYYPDDWVDQLIINSVGKCGYKLKELNGSWNNEDFKTKCWYGFIPGENPHDSDSGHLFIRKVRDVLLINRNRELTFEGIIKKLNKETTPQNVIFVDDFVGSGNQCFMAWRINSVDGVTLAEICSRTHHNCFYAPLIMNKSGYETIRKQCPDLNLETNHILGDDYNLFSPDCLCWNKDSNLYKKGTDMILRKSREVGIPEDDITNELYIKGYYAQGLAIAFEHGIPDACPPFFYWDKNGWTPLIIKQYE